MSKLVNTYPKAVQAHIDLIIACLNDKNESIRHQALDLLGGMVSKKNLKGIVEKLMVFMDKTESTVYKDEVLVKIIDICSRNDYHFIICFEWYVKLLVKLSLVKGIIKRGPLLAEQMLEVVIRVRGIRPFVVYQMTLLFNNAHMFIQTSSDSNMANVLFAAAWICGDYVFELEKPEEILFSMLISKGYLLPGQIQTVFIINIMKIVPLILSKRNTELSIEVCKKVSHALAQYAASKDVEVQERASVALQTINYTHKELENSDVDSICTQFSYLSSEELNMVTPKAQCEVPKALCLDQWINEQVELCPESDHDNNAEKHLSNSLDGFEIIDMEELITKDPVETVTSEDVPTSLNIPCFLSSDKPVFEMVVNKDIRELPDGANNSNETSDAQKETLKMCTPSKDIVQAEELAFRKLAKDKYLIIKYKIVPKIESSNLANVYFRLTNVDINCLIKNIELHFMTNSTDIQFLDKKSEPLSSYKLSKIVKWGMFTEFDLPLQTKNITIPNTLQGTLTYVTHMFQDHNLNENKLDWQLNVAVSDMFLKVDPSVTLVELLWTGQLVFKSSVILLHTNVNKVINLFSTNLNLVLVEKVDETATLYGCTASNEQLCLLVKYNANNVSVEAKCTSQTLVDHLMNEIKSIYNDHAI